MSSAISEGIVSGPWDEAAGEVQEGTVLRKVALRLLPFLFLLYIVNIVDRMNVGFAKLRMLEDLGLDDKVYGLGAGMFYVGYMLFEVPSNFTIAVGTNGYGFFAPTIIELHFPNRDADQIGLLYAIPSLVAAIGMLLFSRHSDRSGERRWHLAGAAFLAAIGWTLSAALQPPWLVLLALTIAFLGMMCMMGPYWSLATSFLSGTAAAGGIALINTIANAGGVLSPYLMGWLKMVTGSFTAGQAMLGLTMLIGSVLALGIRHDPEAERQESNP